MSSAAHDILTADAVFGAFGEDATWSPDDGEPVAVRAILSRRTRLRGDLGDIIDTRPSVSLPAQTVGKAPTGTVTIDSGPLAGKSYALQRPVDGEADGRITRVWVQEAAA